VKTSMKLAAAILALIFTPALAQPVAPKLEVLSVKQNLSDSSSSTMGVTPDGLAVTNTPLMILVHTAFDGHFSNGTIKGLPGWEMNRYDIAGKVSDADRGQLSNLSQPQKIEMIRAMLRAVLADRFQMKWHDDDKEGPVYDLVIAKSGSKLVKPSEAIKKPAPDGPPPLSSVQPPASPPPTRRIKRTTTLAELAMQLSGPNTGRVVIDKTGLTGKYDILLTWSPDPAATEDGPVSASPSSIFTAVQEQLGLKLEPSRGPVKSFVIDHIEKPSEN
jgi:uncharacterized protein (TIGR03435 family)